MSNFFASVDVSVMGRKTYDKMLELTTAQTFSPTIKNYVFSLSRPSGEIDGTTFVRDPVSHWVERIRRQPGKDIWLVGGGEMVNCFLKERLVDEIGLTIHPRLLGDGIVLFHKPYPETQLNLLRCEQYSTGLVQVFYQVNR